MKTILIATDFSKASGNASLYGLQLAKAINANIILFNAYQVPFPPAALNVSISRYNIMKQTEQRLADEANKLAYINMPPLNIVCDEGEAGDVIINVANEKKADFIIVGMKGSGKNFKKIFGSTATSLAKNANLPVIIVPEEAKFKNPGSVVFASDNSIDDKDVPGQLMAITQLFKSKLYVVKVVKSKNEEWFEMAGTPGKLNKGGQISNTSFEYLVDSDIRHALNKAIQKHRANLLVMMPHKHEWLERLFRKSETEDMIFHTRIPLLVLPESSSKFQVSNN